jgi:adenosine deaminase
LTYPKIELHVHLEGTAPPDLIRRIAERNGLELPDGLLAAPDRFAYRDFLDFLDTYDKAASVIRTGEDYRDITYEYLVKCAREGAVYVELTASPDHARLVGLSDEEHIDGIARGIDDARRDSGIEGRILVSAVRNFGVEAALRNMVDAALLAAQTAAGEHAIGRGAAGGEGESHPARAVPAARSSADSATSSITFSSSA